MGLVFISLFWNACTVQKCVYSKGFNIDFRGYTHNKKSSETPEKQVKPRQEYLEEATTEENEVLEARVTQDSTQVLAMIQQTSSDLMVEESSQIKPVTKVVRTKDSRTIRWVKSAPPSDVLSHTNAAPLAPNWLILLLCIFIPPIAVALMPNGNIEKILIALLLWILGVLPGVIYAFLVYLHYL